MDTLSLGEDDFESPADQALPIEEAVSAPVPEAPPVQSAATAPATPKPPAKPTSANPPTRRGDNAKATAPAAKLLELDLANLAPSHPGLASPALASDPASSAPASASDDTPTLDGLPGADRPTEAFSLPDMDISPWDEPADAAALVEQVEAAMRESSALPDQRLGTQAAQNQKIETQAPAGAASADRALSHRLDAIALNEGIEIDELFGQDAEEAADPDSAENPGSPGSPAPRLAALEDYVDALNALGECSAHYLGRAVIVNYWRTSRPGDDWLQAAFAIERTAQSLRLSPDYAASRQSPVTAGQQLALQDWSSQFVGRCSKVIRDFPQLAQQTLSTDQAALLDLPLGTFKE
ncbi:MAG: hypothetical protein HC824_05295 [Synechococcales cyanobacterium RM1_1_8]|nr:hypothetical protein [Synechococcales cyanobacterium RM1_1_8]